MELIPEPAPSLDLSRSATKSRTGSTSERVFVVHGHDDGAKETVARFLQTLGLEPVILHELANKGRTIIEKFEDHSDVAFAIVIFTPDDEGHSKATPTKIEDRARQNVVLELGIFLGLLGRERVAALIWDGVVRPSDYDGVVYTKFDAAGAWKYLLAKELKAARLEIDPSSLFA